MIKETAKLSDIIEITDFEDPKLDVYARIKEIQLLNRANPEDGIFIAESPKVVERALDLHDLKAGFLLFLHIRPVSDLQNP